MSLSKIEMVMKRILFVILVLTISSAYSFAQINEFESANKAYTQEKYNEAIVLYNKILEKGIVSSDVYFNIGNCYYRLSNFPMAILYYEKAKKIDPADGDIDMNLKIANTKIIDKIEPIPQLFFIKWWIIITNLFHFDIWALISVFATAIFFILLFFYLINKTYNGKKILFWLSFTSFLIIILSSIFAYTQYSNINNKDEAIVFTPTLTVKSSPDEKGIDKFVIHEGTKVKILDELNNWVKIKIANGSNGWIEKHNVEII